ncbi:MAG: hypothetical protein QM714_13970 [Nocardioides sp.]|uniref:hypothetical protein n=1 Tax=Nocardioides sp. TaxID=35761 RepID=UPI0039E5437E
MKTAGREVVMRWWQTTLGAGVVAVLAIYAFGILHASPEPPAPRQTVVLKDAPTSSSTAEPSGGPSGRRSRSADPSGGPGRSQSPVEDATLDPDDIDDDGDDDGRDGDDDDDHDRDDRHDDHDDDPDDD